MSNKLLIVCQSAGFLAVDVANEALKRYDKVVFIVGGYSALERPLDEKVTIDRIVKYDKSTTRKRVFTWFWATVQIFHKIFLHYHGYEVMYFTNPPMSYFCSRLLRNKYSVVVWDIYPDALKTIGIGPNSIVWRLWDRINRKSFAKAMRVVTLGETMKKQVAHYCDENKISVAPPWSGSSQFHPIAKQNNSFALQHGIYDKFTVLYSGNIGYTHNVEVLVEVAKIMRYEKDVIFLIIGQGKKKEKIRQMVTDYGLSNVVMLDYQPVDVLPYSLGSADLGVVTLDEDVAAVSVPSKTFNLFAVGAPILAIANEKTEMYRLLTKYGNGRCITKNNVEGIATFIRQLKDDVQLHQSMSQNSLRASADFTERNAKLYFEP